MRTHLIVTALLTTILGACAAEESSSRRGGPPAPGETPTEVAPGTTPPGTVDPATCGGKEFASFDGTNLVADRVVANVGVDRGRFKPFDALAAEYARVLGNTPASLAEAGDTFGKPEARWYGDPTVGGVVLQTAYKVAFDGCLTYTQGPAEFGVAPTAATATAKCTEMARAFWSRTPSPDQITACVDVAVTGAASEASPRRRWAYACASVLSSAGFLTY